MTGVGKRTADIGRLTCAAVGCTGSAILARIAGPITTRLTNAAIPRAAAAIFAAAAGVVAADLFGRTGGARTAAIDACFVAILYAIIAGRWHSRPRWDDRDRDHGFNSDLVRDSIESQEHKVDLVYGWSDKTLNLFAGCAQRNRGS